MKITYLHQYFNTPNMTGGTRSYEMARRLVAMGHEVNMVTSWRELDNRKNLFETFEDDIRVHWIPVPYSNRFNFVDRIFAFFKFAYLSSLLASKLDSDLIFATSTPLTIALPAIYASKKNKIPFIFEIRDLWPEMPIAIGALRNPLLIKVAKAFESWAYYQASSIIALSPGMKQGVVRCGYPSSQIAVIPNSCDNNEFLYQEKAEIDFRSARPWLKDYPLLIYAGTFGRVNGLIYAIDLAVHLARIDSNLRILLVGSGAQREFILQKAYEAGVLGKNLFIEKKLIKKEIPSLFSAANMASCLFVDLPEMRVNSANKFFDCLAAGKPIFINYGGWMHDLILKHQCGISAWGMPLDLVAVKLDFYLNDKEWLSRAGISARNLAESYFDRDLLASQLERVFQCTINGKPGFVENIAPGIY